MSIEKLKLIFLPKNVIKSRNTDPITRKAVGIGNSAVSFHDAVKSIIDQYGGSGGGSGESTAIEGSLFDVMNNPSDPTRTITIGFTAATANRVLAAPNGSDGVPTFRSLVLADIPTITLAKVQDIPAQSVVCRPEAGVGPASTHTLAQNSLLGRVGSGNIRSVTLGTGLAFDGNSIVATGGGGGSTNMARVSTTAAEVKGEVTYFGTTAPTLTFTSNNVATITFNSSSCTLVSAKMYRTGGSAQMTSFQLTVTDSSGAISAVSGIFTPTVNVVLGSAAATNPDGSHLQHEANNNPITTLVLVSGSLRLTTTFPSRASYLFNYSF